MKTEYPYAYFTKEELHAQWADKFTRSTHQSAVASVQNPQVCLGVSDMSRFHPWCSFILHPLLRINSRLDAVLSGWDAQKDPFPNSGQFLEFQLEVVFFSLGYYTCCPKCHLGDEFLNLTCLPGSATGFPSSAHTGAQRQSGLYSTLCPRCLAPSVHLTKLTNPTDSNYCFKICRIVAFLM